MKFMRLPKEVEAMKFTGFNQNAIERWSDGQVKRDSSPNGKQFMVMMTKYGMGATSVGNWVIRGACGLYYPCSDKEFKENYAEIK